MEEALEFHLRWLRTHTKVGLQSCPPFLDVVHLEAFHAVALARRRSSRHLLHELVEQPVYLSPHDPETWDVVQGPGWPPHPADGLLVFAVSLGLLGVLQAQAAEAPRAACPMGFLYELGPIVGGLHRRPLAGQQCTICPIDHLRMVCTLPAGADSSEAREAPEFAHKPLWLLVGLFPLRRVRIDTVVEVGKLDPGFPGPLHDLREVVGGPGERVVGLRGVFNGSRSLRARAVLGLAPLDGFQDADRGDR